LVKANRLVHIKSFVYSGISDELRKKKFTKKYGHVRTPQVYGKTDNGWVKGDEIFSPSKPYAVSRAA